MKFLILICLLLVIQFESTQSDNETPCPNGWIWVQNLEKCFFFSTRITNWRTARKICLQNSGTLIRVLDNANWNFLKSELPRHYSSNSAFYIGLSDLITDGTFEWEHKLNEINKDGLYSKYIYPYYGDRWCKFEPSGRNSLECVAIKIEGNSICYEDRNCSIDIFYGCEKQKSSSDLKSMIKNTFPNIDRINQTLINTLEEFERYRQIVHSNMQRLISLNPKFTTTIQSTVTTTHKPNTSIYCLTEKGRLIQGQVFKRDDCTNCICKSNGQTVCERIACEARTCLDGSVIRQINGLCCPLCESEIRSRYQHLKLKAVHVENDSIEKKTDAS